MLVFSPIWKKPSTLFVSLTHPLPERGHSSWSSITCDNYELIFFLKYGSWSPICFMEKNCFVSLSLHLSHHNTERKDWINLLFTRIRTHEWIDGKAFPIMYKNNTMRLLCLKSIFQHSERRDRKKIIYSNRKVTTVCKAFMWVVVLTSLEPFGLCCMFFRCLHREKMSRRNTVRDTVSGVSVKIVLTSKTSLESWDEFFW